MAIGFQQQSSMGMRKPGPNGLFQPMGFAKPRHAYCGGAAGCAAAGGGGFFPKVMANITSWVPEE